MKKMMLAAALAVAVMGSTQERASAACKFNFSAGFNLSFETSGGSCSFLGFQRQSNPFPCGPAGCAAYPGYGGYPGYAGYAGYPGYAADPGYAAAPAPVAAVPTAQPAPQAQASPVRQAAYYYNSYAAPNYSVSPGYAAPSYWYGE